MTLKADRAASALGRGLGSLIPQRASGAAAVIEVPLARVVPNPHQPRRHWDDAGLEELAASIREHGVLQPVLVTETLDGYQLIAGERRVRASRLAGLERIPALVRQLADRDQLEVALVENVQRSDLDPIEEALAYRQLVDEFGLTQERVAERVGKARTTVANTMRLLDLHPDVQAAIGEGRISEGHGRALGGLPVDGQPHVLGTIEGQGLSVRQAEELVRRLREPRPRTAAEPAVRRLDPDLERVEADLRERLGTKVSLSRSRNGGRIVIEYYSDEELGRLYERLIGGNA
jgi:ParB family chromosome partitioning protein